MRAQSKSPTTYTFLQPLTPTHEVPNPNALPPINEYSFKGPLTPEHFERKRRLAKVKMDSQSESKAEEAPTTGGIFDAAHGLGVDSIPSSNSFTRTKQLQEDSASIGVCPKDNQNDASDIAKAVALHAGLGDELHSICTVSDEFDRISREMNELRDEVVQIVKSLQSKIDSDSRSKKFQ
ncbi:hypothetical protein R3P38DRAFT_2799368 [Favolaschia claudopus]|uniref:Uncharacterized protein n=1 Tax=Favolaschia claudopus TaxID=2862362 RepID=A0AAW0A100_9AGAR